MIVQQNYFSDLCPMKREFVKSIYFWEAKYMRIIIIGTLQNMKTCFLSMGTNRINEICFDNKDGILQYQ